MTDDVIPLDQERTKRRPDTDPDDAQIAEATGLLDGLIFTPATTLREAVYKGGALHASILKFHDAEHVVSRLCEALLEDMLQISLQFGGAS